MFPEAACTLCFSLPAPSLHLLLSDSTPQATVMGPRLRLGRSPGWFCGDGLGEWACLCPLEAGSTILEAPSHREKETDSKPRPGPVAR